MSSLRLWERNCGIKYEARYFKFKNCLLEGKNLAQTWSKKCKDTIEYEPKIPDPPSKEAQIILQQKIARKKKMR